MEYICPFEDNQEFSSCSGCESGWTLYLGHDSSVSPPLAFSDVQEHEFFDDEEEEEEDLSMVSDASSGPPQYLNEEDSYGTTGKDNNNGGCFYHCENVKESALSGKNLKRQKIEENPVIGIKDINEDHQSSSNLLDDTASSPFFGFSNERFTHTRSSQASMENELDYSQGYSTTHFEGRDHNYHGTHDFFQSSVSGNQQYQNKLSVVLKGSDGDSKRWEFTKR